jgi:protease I
MLNETIYWSVAAIVGAQKKEVAMTQKQQIAKTRVLAIQFTGNPGWIPIDARIEEATVEDYDAVYVPGGAWNPDQLRANPAVLSFLQEFQATGKLLGALCHGSQVFLSAKLTKGRKATGYWPIMEDMANAGPLCGTSLWWSTRT